MNPINNRSFFKGSANRGLVFQAPSGDELTIFIKNNGFELQLLTSTKNEPPHYDWFFADFDGVRPFCRLLTNDQAGPK